MSQFKEIPDEVIPAQGTPHQDMDEGNEEIDMDREQLRYELERSLGYGQGGRHEASVLLKLHDVLDEIYLLWHSNVTTIDQRERWRTQPTDMDYMAEYVSFMLLNWDSKFSNLVRYHLEHGIDNDNQDLEADLNRFVKAQLRREHPTGADSICIHGIKTEIWKSIGLIVDKKLAEKPDETT